MFIWLSLPTVHNASLSLSRSCSSRFCCSRWTHITELAKQAENKCWCWWDKEIESSEKKKIGIGFAVPFRRTIFIFSVFNFWLNSVCTVRARCTVYIWYTVREWVHSCWVRARTPPLPLSDVIAVVIIIIVVTHMCKIRVDAALLPHLRECKCVCAMIARYDSDTAV